MYPRRKHSRAPLRYAPYVTTFDLCILGAGSAGIAGAFRASQLGANVALVHAGPLGGTGIRDGALSSKTLWHLSSDYARAERRDRGYEGPPLHLRWPAVLATMEAACREATNLLAQQLQRLATPAAGRGTVRLVEGYGELVNGNMVQVGATSIEARAILVATGSRPRQVPGIEIDGECIVTSDHIERIAQLPRRLGIVGAGVVGCEYATIFAQFGQTTVELFDRQERILPFEDADISNVVAKRFSELGVVAHQRARITQAKRVGNEVVIEFATAQGPQTTVVDVLLVAAGRVPNVRGIGLENVGVVPDASGYLPSQGPRLSQTVWAAGDVTPELMLANLADIEARAAVEEILGQPKRRVVVEAQPAIYFLSPEIGVVGHNEQSARKAGIPYRAAVVTNQLGRRNIAMRATDGLVKLLAAPDGTLLGLRVVGPQAGTCIQGVALLMGRGGTIHDLDAAVHPHPAVTEGVQEAARLLLGSSTFVPEAFPRDCYVTEG